MEEFQNFDEYHHKKSIIHIGSASYEIWHQKVLPDNKVQEIAERIHKNETNAGKEPVGFHCRDFRDFYDNV